MKDNQVGAVAIIWGSAMIISFFSFVFGIDGAFALVIIMAVMALAATGMVLDKNFGSSNALKSSLDADGSEKPKRSQNEMSEMLALLDEDDRYELRQRIKQQLMQRIEGSGDGELSSLDALLAEDDHYHTARH